MPDQNLPTDLNVPTDAAPAESLTTTTKLVIATPIVLTIAYVVRKVIRQRSFDKANAEFAAQFDPPAAPAE